MFAIVDIETTGGSAQKHRITEIAVYLFDGFKVVEEFATLINPECYIPSQITQLTGITNEMVANAPKFYEVARKIVEITENATFVAHNVQFDYKFIQEEFKRLGYSYSRNTLCTVRLSRKHIPGFRSYSLGALCSELHISINGRHRAAGDALATVKLFEKLLDVEPSIREEVGGNQSAIEKLAPNIDPAIVYKLPESTGVYFFYSNSGDFLYIGKSINIKKRVLDHFSNPQTKRAIEMLSQVSSVGFELTGSELIALIVEADAIKENLPRFNIRGRRKGSQYGLFSQVDSMGYINFNLTKVSNSAETPLACFENLTDAQSMLYRMVDQYSLCQKLCGLYQSANACFHFQIGQCKGACIGKESAASYNKRAQEAIDGLGLGSKSFILVDKGRNSEEKSFVKVVNGKIEGYGFFDPEYIGKATEFLNESFTPCGNHREAILAVRSFMGRSGIKIVDIK